MSVDIYDSEKAAIRLQETVNDGDEVPNPIVEGDHWKLGSSLKLMSTREWEAEQMTNPAFRHFELKLVSFWREYLLNEQLLQPIEVSRDGLGIYVV